MAQPDDRQSGDRRCSDRTLRGDYGYAAEGVLLPGPGVVLQFRGVGLTHFDGRGDLRWVEHTVINGKSLESGWTAASGTYTVNSDCTGTAIVNTPNSPVPLNLAFVVVRQGSEIHTVLDANAISTVFIKVEGHGRNHDEAGDED
ncbi:MAG: hypothetical protein ACR2JE_07240 [Acidobacteriaceae bacterium]